MRIIIGGLYENDARGIVKSVAKGATQSERTKQVATNKKAAETPNEEAAAEPVVAPDPMAGIRAGLLPVIETNIATIKALDVKLAETAGTIAAKLKAATDEVVAEAPDIAPTDEGAGLWQSILDNIGAAKMIHPLSARKVIDSMLVELKDLRAELDQDIEGVVRGKLKNTSSSSEAMATMRTQRAELVVSTKAMCVLVDGKADGETADQIPNAPKGTGSATTSSGGPAVTSKHGRVYRLKDGTRTYYAKDDLSYMAFSLGVAIEDLEAVIRAAGVTEFTKPWERTITVKGVKSPKEGKSTTTTIGFETN